MNRWRWKHDATRMDKYAARTTSSKPTSVVYHADFAAPLTAFLRAVESASPDLAAAREALSRAAQPLVPGGSTHGVEVRYRPTPRHGST